MGIYIPVILYARHTFTGRSKSVDYIIEMSWIPRLNKKVMITTLARITSVSFFPMNLISRINDEMQIEVDVREKAMAVPRGKWLYCKSGCKNRTSEPLQK